MEIPIAGRLIDLDDAERQELRRGWTVCRGQGYSLHVTAAPDLHQALHAAAAPLYAGDASSADRLVYRIYGDRLQLAATIAALPADTRPLRRRWEVDGAAPGTRSAGAPGAR